jgi:hypothetical protein
MGAIPTLAKIFVKLKFAANDGLIDPHSTHQGPQLFLRPTPPLLLVAQQNQGVGHLRQLAPNLSPPGLGGAGGEGEHLAVGDAQAGDRVAGDAPGGGGELKGVVSCTRSVRALLFRGYTEKKKRVSSAATRAKSA